LEKTKVTASKTMAEIEILPQKIVDTRTIILKTRLDPSRVKLQGDKLKGVSSTGRVF
jgi:hypothetical protein